MKLRNRILKSMLARQFAGWSDGTVEEQRANQENRLGRFVRLPGGTKFDPVVANGVNAEWIKAAESDSGAILYLHGGVFTMGSINTHREFAARLAQATEVPALLLGYRLAPEHPFPAALEDTLKAYRWLLDQGISPARIILAGDSAGGGLALATLIALRDAVEPLPAGAVCISPWADLALGGATIESKAAVDPVLGGVALSRYVAYYAGDNDVMSPLISPLYADLQGLPPLLIQVGTEEILLDDATRVADRARAAGAPVNLEIWDEMVHVFQLIPFLPEAKKAVAQIAVFVSDALSPSR
jgi:monoterpene epsilon-lactone hydrolase